MSKLKFGGSKDLTTGNPMKLILNFGVPLLFGMLFQQFYNMVDSVIVGKQLGVNALAAVGSTGSINFMVLGFCIGICNGFAIPIAQAFGAKDTNRLKSYIANCAWCSILFAIVLTIIIGIFTKDILTVMRTPADIFDDAYIYIFIIFMGIPGNNTLQHGIRCSPLPRRQLYTGSISDIFFYIKYHTRPYPCKKDGCKRCSRCDSHGTGSFRHNLSYLHREKIQTS